MQYDTLYDFGKSVIQHRIPNVEQLNAVIALDSGKRNGLLKCLAELVGEDVLVPLVKASIVHVKGHIRNGRPVKGYNRRMAEHDDIETFLKNDAEPLRLIKYSIEAYQSDFPDGTVETPIGTVRLGDGQKEKLLRKGRENRFGFIKPTFERPSLILREDDSPEETERNKREGKTIYRNWKYSFIKVFSGEGRNVYFCNVTVSRGEGIEVAISLHDLRKQQLLNRLKKSRIVWKKGVGRTSPEALLP